MSDAKKIMSALGNVDEKFIEEASEPGQLTLDEPAFETVRVKKKTNWKVWVGSVAAVVAVAVGIGIGAGGANKGMTESASVASKETMMAADLSTAAADAEEAGIEAPMEMAEEPASTESVIDLTASDGTEDVPDSANGLILASVDNSEYLEKCASSGLTAGAPVYPDSIKNPDAGFDETDSNADWEAYSKASSAYYDARRAKFEQTRGYEEPLKAFTETTAKQFLTGKEDNTVYSPLNVYMALSMLCELTEGDSRQQILDLLGLENIEAVREEAKKLWLASYTDDGLTTLLLGTGAWVDQDFDVNYEALNTLVEKYYAFYVSGDMQSDEMAQSFRDWLSAQTKGLLDDFISAEKFDPETVLALASTIYYKANWQDVFREESTEDSVFHALTGDQTVPFMNEVRSSIMMWGDNFSATAKNMTGDGRMYLILPDEGSSTDDVLASPEFWSMLVDDEYENTKYGVIVTLSVPKFDVSSGSDLTDGLKVLGVTDVFNRDKSDFSPLTSQSGMYVGKVSHNARVKIDEEGVEAAAYTAIMVAGSSMPTEYADFICDRPFIFTIVHDGAVLFMGTVNSIE